MGVVLVTMPVAIVTGANKGIGFGIVRGLCKKFEGDVYLTARDETRGLAAVDELKKEGLNPKFHLLDLGNEQTIVKLRDFMKETYGGIDVLVNNAGMAFKNFFDPLCSFLLLVILNLSLNCFQFKRILLSSKSLDP